MKLKRLVFFLFSFFAVFFFFFKPSLATVVESLDFMQAKLQKEGLIENENLKQPKHIKKVKGIWVNIWNYPNDLDVFFNRLKNFEINTIYLQVNRSTTPVFKHPQAFDEILEEAHKNKIKVIGWTYCYLRDVNADIEKFVEPAKYKSSKGHSLDGMAADIEENLNLAAVTKYTEGIKAALPKDYPLQAIVFSPRIKPNYPWEYIGKNWDVLMPMTYWHGIKNRDSKLVYDFVKDTIVNLRKFTNKPDLNIHLITDGERTSPEEVRISLELAKELKINSGISIYPEHLVTDSILEEIKKY